MNFRLLARPTSLVVLLAMPLAAQETPTEREAARGVISTMDSLERSIDVATLVRRLTGPNAARDAVVARATELMRTELLALGGCLLRGERRGE